MSQQRARRRVARIVGAVGLCATLTSGCAVHYFDPETGAEHIWGVGHMVMKATVPAEGIQTVVRQTEVLGLAAGKAGPEYSLTLGWARSQRLEVVEESAQVRLEWPSSSLLHVRVGSEWPHWYEGAPAAAEKEMSP